MHRSQTQQTPTRASWWGSSHARLGAGLGVALVLAAAGATGARGQDDQAAASPLASLPAATYPLTLVDDEGTRVVISARPQRIISLSPANTEIAFALGAGDRLVGGTDFDDFPAQAATLPDVATFGGVLMEQVVALEPDLALAGGNGLTPPGDIARMRDLDIPVVVVYPETIDEVLADIELIGAALGTTGTAGEITRDMRDRLDQVAAAAAAIGTRPRVFYQTGSGTEIFGIAPESAYEDMIELAGGEPITTGDPAVWSMPLERLVAADPEVIVVGDANYGVCPRDVMARPGWSGMTAVREGAVRPVNDVVVTRTGPRLPEGLASLARAIHPELELPGFDPDPPICAAS